MTPQVKPTTRETQRLQTRERILGAAIAEFKRSGMADAEVNSIVAAAGVAHGTFYFHFPTKEHVLLELERREEARVAAQFERFLAGTHELASALTEVVALVQGIERRFGSPLFKELVALHFSPSRPESENWTDHPVIVQLVREIERARAQGPCIRTWTRSPMRCSSCSASTACSAQANPSQAATPCWKSWSLPRYAA